MTKRLRDEDFYALSEFRYEIRKFNMAADEVAASGGLERQQYSFLLQLRGLHKSLQPTIAVLAERLKVGHNSMVGLVDRLEAKKLVFRKHATDDARKVLVFLTSKGEKLITQMVAKRFDALSKQQPGLLRSLGHVLASVNAKSRRKKR